MPATLPLSERVTDQPTNEKTRCHLTAGAQPKSAMVIIRGGSVLQSKGGSSLESVQAASVRGVRRGLFGLRAMLLPALIVFGLLEIALRVAGYGYPTGFFRKIPGRSACTTNERFGRRFFPPSLVRIPLPCLFSDPKPLDTYRIFVLGGSAAQGFPEARYSLGRLLEAMLNDSFTGVRFEVINTGMTAINSNVVVPIARDCAKFEPDLFVVYLGNNEVIGPYGPGTVFGGGSPSWWMIRLALWLKTTKIGQFLSSLVHSLAASCWKGGAWTGMEMFLANRIRGDDPRLAGVYERFRGNLLDICRAAQDARARVLLCSVASNLRANGPFASLHRSDLGPEEEQLWEQAYHAGVDLQEAGRSAEAIARFQDALAIDPQFAELEFRLAQCSVAEECTLAAREHYVLAREWDALRFRSCEPINAAIRAVAAETEKAGVVLVDAERLLAENPATPVGVPGDEWFWDHVHFNWEGNYALAQVLFQEVVRRLPAGIAPPVGRSLAPPSPERCAELLLLTDWDRYRMAQRIGSMLDKQPFAGQLDHERRSTARHEALLALSARLDGEAMRRITARHAQGVARAPEDLYFRENLARLLGEVGDFAGAERQWRELLTRVPGVADWVSGVGLSLLDQGSTTAAITIFRTQLRHNRRSVDALTNLGLAYARAGRLDEAAKQFDRAVSIAPNAPEPLNNLGMVARARGDLDGAVERFRRALEANPSFYDAHMNLAEILADRGDTQEAIDHYHSVLREAPRALLAAFQLVRLLMAQMRFAEAEEASREALKAQPRCADLHGLLALALENQGHVAAAEAEYEAALLIDPNHADAHLGLGRLLADEGTHPAVAAQHLRRVLELRPDWPPALDQLAWLLATTRDERVADPEEAVRLAERACQLTRNLEPAYLRTAAAASAAVGKIAEAVVLAARARERILAIGDSGLLEETEQELERYRRMLPADAAPVGR